MSECAGCGAECGTGWSSTDWSGMIAPGHRVSICRGRYAHEPKLACWDRALKKLRVCPGCGEDMGSWLPGKLCDACCKNLQEGEKANLGEPLLVASLKTYHLVSISDVSHRARIEAEKFAERFIGLLGRAVSGRGARAIREEHSEVRADVTMGQKEALAGLGKAMAELITKVYTEGKADGRSWVASLAAGDVTYRDVDAVINGGEDR